MDYIEGGEDKLQLPKLFNKGLTFVDNFDCAILEVTLDEADEAQEIRHSLRRVPIGYIIIYQDQEAIIWGTQLSDWTEEVLYLVSNVSSVVIRLLVM